MERLPTVGSHETPSTRAVLVTMVLGLALLALAIVVFSWTDGDPADESPFAAFLPPDLAVSSFVITVEGPVASWAAAGGSSQPSIGTARTTTWYVAPDTSRSMTELIDGIGNVYSRIDSVVLEGMTRQLVERIAGGKVVDTSKSVTVVEPTQAGATLQAGAPLVGVQGLEECYPKASLGDERLIAGRRAQRLDLGASVCPDAYDGSGGRDDRRVWVDVETAFVLLDEWTSPATGELVSQKVTALEYNVDVPQSVFD